MDIREILLNMDQLVAFYKREMPNVDRLVLERHQLQTLKRAVKNGKTSDVYQRGEDLFYKNFRLVSQ